MHANLGTATNFTDEHDPLRLWILTEVAQAIDEVGAWCMCKYFGYPYHMLGIHH